MWKSGHIFLTLHFILTLLNRLIFPFFYLTHPRVIITSHFSIARVGRGKEFQTHVTAAHSFTLRLMRTSCQLLTNFSRREEQHEISKMAMAVFTSRPNSHPFEERRVLLTEPVKIGRSVAKSRPAANNCIFDCKVLSRNHAILWYEDGKVSMTVWLIIKVMFTSRNDL